MVEEMVLSLMLTDFSRWLCSGWIKVRAIYLFLMKPTPYGMPDCSGIAEGGVQAGVRHADDHVRLNGVLQRQKGARRAARAGVDAAAVYDGVRTGKVDVLKDAQRAGRTGRSGAVMLRRPPLSADHDLAGTHVPHELCTDAVQRAALGGKDPAVCPAAPMQSGRKPWGSRTAISLLGRHDDQRVRALDPVHGGSRPPPRWRPRA